MSCPANGTLNIAHIPANGECSIFVFVPLTGTGDSLGGCISGEGYHSLGFSQIGAALLAESHFNARNASVVPELAHLKDCNATIRIEKGNVFDSVPQTHTASQEFYFANSVPCAVAGPSSDGVAVDLSAMAQSAKAPIVLARAFNTRLSYKHYFDYTVSVYPGMIETSVAMVSFLEYKERDYIAFMFEITDTGIQRREVLEIVFDSYGMKHIEAGFVTKAQPAEMHLLQDGLRSPHEALMKIKQSGYRTIVVALEFPESSFPLLADAAVDLGMAGPEYLWLWWDAEPPEHLWYANANNSKLLIGSGAVSANYNFKREKFVEAWQDRDDLVDKLNRVNPIKKGQAGYYFADPTYFSKSLPPMMADYFYDAVMSIALGACGVKREPDGRILGFNHRENILRQSFMGATGNVTFAVSQNRSSRLLETLTWGSRNFLENGWAISDYAMPTQNNTVTWQPFFGFVYKDGTETPPLPLRADGDMNYLSTRQRAIGLSIMSVTILGALVCGIWVVRNRKHRVMTSAQPVFLQIILFGCILVSSAVFNFSMDEGAGWSVGQLDKLCASSPWQIMVGFMLVYTALATKLFRVHKILQFSRRKLNSLHILLPMGLLNGMAFVALLTWTLVDPLQWDRRMIDESTNETIGSCASSSVIPFGVTLLIIALSPVFMTLYMAYKTQDVDNAYAEGWYILVMICFQLEAFAIAIPVVVLLTQSSQPGLQYFGILAAIIALPASTMVCLIVPKMVDHYKETHGKKSNKRKRGELGNGQVTGLQEPNLPATAVASVGGAAQHGDNEGAQQNGASNAGTLGTKGESANHHGEEEP